MSPKHATILIGSAAFALLTVAVVNCQAAPQIPEDCKTGGFVIGCQAWSFNRFTVFEAIEKTAAAGGKIIEFYPGQRLSKAEPGVKLDEKASDEVIAKVQAKLKEHGVKAVNYGVVPVPANEANARKLFAFAKKLGLYAITTESTEQINLIEKLVKEYDICVGFHDHPKRENNSKYRMWDPNYVLEVCKGRDPRIGSCADTGHWARSNLKPVECLRILKGRIISSHLKDLDKMGPDAHDVPYGTGVCDVKACLDELKAQGFSGNISIEYEYHWDNNVPEITKCIDFVRQYGAAK